MIFRDCLGDQVALIESSGDSNLTNFKFHFHVVLIGIFYVFYQFCPTMQTKKKTNTPTHATIHYYVFRIFWKRPRAPTGGDGRRRAATGGFEQRRAATGGDGRPRAATGSHGRRRAATGGNERPSPRQWFSFSGLVVYGWAKPAPRVGGLSYPTPAGRVGGLRPPQFLTNPAIR